MPYIPHTEEDIQEMLSTIGVDSIDTLFDEIPKALLSEGLKQVPTSMSEMAITRLMHERADRDGMPLNFIGAGAYEHHIPAAVWQITTRGEFYTAYTPYQAEASQGTLQLLYEFQTMMASLTGMEVSNASLYDGASAVAEAVLMAIRANRKCKSKKVLVPTTLNPIHRRVVEAIVTNQEIELVDVEFDKESGIVDTSKLPAGEYAAMVIAQPNFFGRLEDVDALTDWAHRQGIFVIAVVNPTSLALLKAPGQWGEQGADIVCGEGQPLGVPLSSGGPYFGFMCAKQEYVRQMPGRIIGRTVDTDGKEGFALTLQAREQHIRRSKATSNICTNQGLLVTAATIYMSLVGYTGLQQVAKASHINAQSLRNRIAKLPGVEALFDGPSFHEFVVRLNAPVNEVITRMLDQNIVAGFDLSESYPDLGQCLLVCVTETKSEADLVAYANALAGALKNAQAA